MGFTVLLPAPHVRAVEALCCVRLRSVGTIRVAARLLGGRDLGLQSRGVRVDPLQLCKMSVEHADDLAQLDQKLASGIFTR